MIRLHRRIDVAALTLLGPAAIRALLGGLVDIEEHVHSRGHVPEPLFLAHLRGGLRYAVGLAASAR